MRLAQAMPRETDVGHIVEFEGSEGGATFQECTDLADAVSLVERLRNDRGIVRTRILRTEEIRFDFKPYYRVELGDPDATEAAARAERDGEDDPAEAAAPHAPLASAIALPRIVIAPAPVGPREPAASDDADASDGGTDVDEETEEMEREFSPRRGLFGR
jgi:hypothetical protein